MIFKSINDIECTKREVLASNGNWISKRLLLNEDNMGFSLHLTTIFSGTETLILYKNHLEAVYCIEGYGEVEVLKMVKYTKLNPARCMHLTNMTVIILEHIMTLN